MNHRRKKYYVTVDVKDAYSTEYNLSRNNIHEWLRELDDALSKCSSDSDQVSLLIVWQQILDFLDDTVKVSEKTYSICNDILDSYLLSLSAYFLTRRCSNHNFDCFSCEYLPMCNKFHGVVERIQFYSTSDLAMFRVYSLDILHYRELLLAGFGDRLLTYLSL